MRMVKNKKGLGLPAVLAVIIFLLATTVILVTSIYNSSYLIASNYENNQEYLNASSAVETVAKIIVRDEDLTPTFLDDLASYMGVTIEVYNDDIYRISKELSSGESVYSYITGSASTISSTSINMYDEVFSYTGLDDYEHNLFLEPAIICSAYMNQFMQNTFPSLGYDEYFSDFDSMFSYYEDLTDQGDTYTKIAANVLSNMSNPVVGGHWFIDGNLQIGSNKTLTIPDGNVLFVNGKLILGKRCKIDGIVIVNGTVDFNTLRLWGTLNGTVYCDGDFAMQGFQMGTYARPSFIFANGDIAGRNDLVGYGYLYSMGVISVDKKATGINLIGGAYATEYVFVKENQITVNEDLDTQQFYYYGVPQYVPIQSEGGGSSEFIYTSPR